jgi:hypothetical protein
MNEKKASRLNIITSIIFAVTMISIALILKDTEYNKYSETAVFLIIALWFIPFSYFSRFTRDKCEAKDR